MSEELKKEIVDSELAASEWVTIGEFPEPMEAEMVKLRLESAGIETFMSGENAAIMVPGLGPLNVQVRSADKADALAILADAGNGISAESEAP